MLCFLPGRFNSCFQYVDAIVSKINSLLRSIEFLYELTDCFNILIGNIDISRLREAAKTKTNDEDAWSEGCTLLVDILRLLLVPFSSLHDLLHGRWVRYRYQLIPHY
jgi:hypothetical protein